MQDAFLPAARLALNENLEKQAVKAWRRGKDCKVSGFVKGRVKAGSESTALFWHPNATSNLWLYASSALGVKLLAVCLDFTAFLGLETESAEREGVQRPECRVLRWFYKSWFFLFSVYQELLMSLGAMEGLACKA